MLPPAFSWFLAYRYLVSRWINLVGMLGIALAVWAMIVVVAVFSGFIDDTQRSIEQASPDLLLTGLAPDADYGPIAAALATDPDVVATSPRLSHDGILYPIGGWQIAPHSDPTAASAAGNRYLLLVGIDPAAEAKTTGFAGWVRPGEDKERDAFLLQRFDSREYWTEDVTRPLRVSPERIREAAAETGARLPEGKLLGSESGILLGMLRLRIGDKLVAGQRIDVMSARFAKAADGKFELRKIKINTRLAGGFETGHRFFDLGTCFIDIEEMREAKGLDPIFDPALVSEVAVRLRDGADPVAAGARLQALLEKDHGGGIALTWQQQNDTYLQAVNRERTLMKVVLFAVLVVAGFLIFATLHMMVVQKTKDIGILTSLGATSASVGSIFVVSSLAVGMAGCTLGLVTGYLSAYFLNDICEFLGVPLFPPTLYAIDEVPIDLEPAWMVQVALGALVLSLLVAWLPARRAARQDPVRALMHE